MTAQKLCIPAKSETTGEKKNSRKEFLFPEKYRYICGRFGFRLLMQGEE